MQWTPQFSLKFWLLSCVFGSILMTSIFIRGEKDMLDMLAVMPFFLSFMSLTRGIPSLIVFALIGALLKKFELKLWLRHTIMLLLALCLGFLNMFLVLGRNKPDRFFSFENIGFTLPFMAGIVIAFGLLFYLRKRNSSSVAVIQESVDTTQTNNHDATV